MKKYILALVCFPFITGCSNSRKLADQPIPASEVEVLIPCSGEGFLPIKNILEQIVLVKA